MSRPVPPNEALGSVKENWHGSTWSLVKDAAIVRGLEVQPYSGSNLEKLEKKHVVCEALAKWYAALDAVAPAPELIEFDRVALLEEMTRLGVDVSRAMYAAKTNDALVNEVLRTHIARHPGTPEDPPEGDFFDKELYKNNLIDTPTRLVN